MGVNRFAKSVEKALDGPHKQLAKMDQGIRALGRGVAVAGTAAAIGLSAAAAPGANFEHTLASLNAVAKPTVDELAKIAEVAQDIGPKFGFSATEVASGMEAMSKQGLSVQEVVAGVGGVAAAAAADGSSLNDTMGGLLATMAGMGKGAGDLQHIADVMAKAGDSTAASIGSLAESMSVFGPTAKSLGIGIEDAIGQLAVLQDAGIDASSAGTTLSAVYSKLASPTAETAKALKKLGLSVKDSMGNLKPPQQLMAEIFRATQGIQGNVGQMAAFTDLVGLNSQKALLNLAASVGSGKLDKVLGELKTNVDGYSAAIASAKQDSFIGDLNKLKASAEGVGIALFSTASGPLRELVSGITAWVSANKELIATNVQAFVAGLIQALPTIGYWVEKIGKLLVGFYAIRTVTALIYGLSAAWTTVTAAFASGGWVMLNPWTAVILAIAALVVVVWAFWPEISAFFGRVWGAVKGFAANAWATITSWGASLLSWFGGLWNAVKGPVMSLTTFFVGLVALWAKPYVWAFQQISTFAAWAFGKVAGVARWAWGHIKEIWAPIGSWFSSAWSSVVATASSVWGAIAGFAASAWGSIVATATGVYDSIVGVFEPLVGWFSGIWQSISGAFSSSLGWVVDKLSGLASLAGGLIGDVQGEGARVLGVEDRPVTGGTTNPNASISREIKESNSNSSSTVTIVSDKPARLNKPTPGVRLRAPAPSGAF